MTSLDLVLNLLHSSFPPMVGTFPFKTVALSLQPRIGSMCSLGLNICIPLPSFRGDLLPKEVTLRFPFTGLMQDFFFEENKKN